VEALCSYEVGEMRKAVSDSIDAKSVEDLRGEHCPVCGRQDDDVIRYGTFGDEVQVSCPDCGIVRG